MMNNSITNWVINFVEEHSPDEFCKQDICDAIWLDQGLENGNDPTYFFIAAMDSVDWDAVEESFYPSLVEVSWSINIIHEGYRQIEFDSREEYEIYKNDPEGYLCEYIDHDFLGEAHSTAVIDIQVEEA